MNNRIGIVGLGRMGQGIAGRLLTGGIEVCGYNRTFSVARDMETKGLVPARSLEELVEFLEPPRTVWVMLPAGEPTATTLDLLAELLAPGDCLIDGGNSDSRDTLKRADAITDRGLLFADVGVSGGIWGEHEGFGLMFGAFEETARRVRPFISVLAPSQDRGWVHVGPPGSGHFAKMVHNGIEYGIMQSYAEGFALLKKKEEFGIDLQALASAWCNGTVIRSWLLELLAGALREDPSLSEVVPRVADSGEARWALREAVDLAVPAPVLASSLFERFGSRDAEAYGARILTVLRGAFGGHAVERGEGF